MALWNGVSQAASVAGVDAYSLIKMIADAAQTVRRNREACEKLARRAGMIGDLLRQLHGDVGGGEAAAPPQLMRHRDTRSPVEQLEETLRRAYLLVSACRERGYLYRCFMGGSQACQLREVENDIAFYLQLFPLVGYVDTTRTWVRHFSNRGDQPSSTDQIGGSIFYQESMEETQVLECHSSHKLEGTGEMVESRLQGVNEHSTDNIEQLARSDIFYGSHKRKMKGHVNKDIQLKLLATERRSKLLMFSFSQVVEFTENFKCENVVGRGAFGYVYKGKLSCGTEIAVKRFSSFSAQGSEEFTAEIETIGNLQHNNVIRLLGFCTQREKHFTGFHIQGEEMILVYEYMPNKSLASFLYSYTKIEESLNWSKSLHIIEGVAQGLVYLHEHSHQCIVHMDLKASNILLDNEMNPKISDFGMARILASSGAEETSDIVKGTSGYLDPEYIRTWKFSVRSDVYNFGSMILEIISRKRCLSLLPNGHIVDLPTCAWEMWQTGKPHELHDSSLCNEQEIAQIIRCIHVALLCIQDCPMYRPAMLDVLVMLRSNIVRLPIPKVPNHANEYPGDVLDSQRLWEVNVPLQ